MYKDLHDLILKFYYMKVLCLIEIIRWKIIRQLFIQKNFVRFIKLG